MADNSDEGGHLIMLVVRPKPRRMTPDSAQESGQPRATSNPFAVTDEFLRQAHR